MARDPLCKEEWATLQNNKRHGLYLRSRRHFRLPECETLPSVHDNTTGCTYTDLLDIAGAKLTSEFKIITSI